MSRRNGRKKKDAIVPEEMPVALQAKIASVVVHADEWLDTGHPFDHEALSAAVRDPEVQAWIERLGALAPVRRQPKQSDKG